MDAAEELASLRAENSRLKRQLSATRKAAGEATMTTAEITKKKEVACKHAIDFGRRIHGSSTRDYKWTGPDATVVGEWLEHNRPQLRMKACIEKLQESSVLGAHAQKVLFQLLKDWSSSLNMLQMQHQAAAEHFLKAYPAFVEWLASSKGLLVSRIALTDYIDLVNEYEGVLRTDDLEAMQVMEQFRRVRQRVDREEELANEIIDNALA